MRSLTVVSGTTFSNQVSPGTKPRGWSYGTTSSSPLVLQGKGQGLCDRPQWERCQLSANLQCSQTHLLQLGIRGEVQTALRDSSSVFCVGSSGLRQLEKGENMWSGVRGIPFWQVTYQLCNFEQVLSPVRVSRVTFTKWGLKRPASGDYGEDWVRWWKWTDWQSLQPQSPQGWSSNSHQVWCLPSLLLFGFFFLLTKK